MNLPSISTFKKTVETPFYNEINFIYFYFKDYIRKIIDHLFCFVLLNSILRIFFLLIKKILMSTFLYVIYNVQ